MREPGKEPKIVQQNPQQQNGKVRGKSNLTYPAWNTHKLVGCLVCVCVSVCKVYMAIQYTGSNVIHNPKMKYNSLCFGLNR